MLGSVLERSRQEETVGLEETGSATRGTTPSLLLNYCEDELHRMEGFLADLLSYTP